MRGKLLREVVGWNIGLVIGLQVLADCILLRLSSGTTVLLMVAAILFTGNQAVKALDRWAEQDSCRKPRHRKVRMYNLKEIQTPDWPMIEI